MKQDVIDSIGKMTANGNRLELPKSEQITNYPQVKKALLAAGGKYKNCGFEFPGDAQTFKDRLTGGEEINDKKKFQFFATPPELAERVVKLAGIEAGDSVLEPSAGHGALLDLAVKAGACCTAIELMHFNVQELIRLGHEVIEGCFLKQSADDLGLFDKIVANPPFTKNQDIDHIRHMFTFLAPGGKLVSLASQSWVFGDQKKHADFRAWLISIGGTITDVPAGSFRSSGTAVAAAIVEIELYDIAGDGDCG